MTRPHGSQFSLVWQPCHVQTRNRPKGTGSVALRQMQMQMQLLRVPVCSCVPCRAFVKRRWIGGVGGLGGVWFGLVWFGLVGLPWHCTYTVPPSVRGTFTTGAGVCRKTKGPGKETSPRLSHTARNLVMAGTGHHNSPSNHESRQKGQTEDEGRKLFESGINARAQPPRGRKGHCALYQVGCRMKRPKRREFAAGCNEDRQITYHRGYGLVLHTGSVACRGRNVDGGNSSWQRSGLPRAVCPFVPPHSSIVCGFPPV